MTLADPTTELEAGAKSGPGDAKDSGGGDAAASGAGTASGAPAADAKKPRKARTTKTAEEVIAEAEEANKKAKAKADEALAKAIAKAKREAVPLGTRKTTAFDLLEKLRAHVRTAEGKADLDDAAVDVEITTAIHAAFESATASKTA